MGINVSSVGKDELHVCKASDVQIGTGVGGAAVSNLFTVQGHVEVLGLFIYFHDLVDTTTLSGFGWEITDGVTTTSLCGASFLDLSSGGADPVVAGETAYAPDLSNALIHTAVVQPAAFIQFGGCLSSLPEFYVENPSTIRFVYTEDTDTDIQADVYLYYRVRGGVGTSVSAV